MLPEKEGRLSIIILIFNSKFLALNPFTYSCFPWRSSYVAWPENSTKNVTHKIYLTLLAKSKLRTGQGSANRYKRQLLLGVKCGKLSLDL